MIVAGRRNNPPERGVRLLCGFNPLHWMELPELFMEFISSMTGKSPWTTGAGRRARSPRIRSNALPTVLDLNASLLSFALTGYDGWISAAGWIGPEIRIDHDFSLLVPEVLSRMTEQERDAEPLLDNGFLEAVPPDLEPVPDLEAVPDLEVGGRTVLSSRLGYRMTERFASIHFGRISMHPEVVFTPEMLRPELQDAAVFAESMDTMVTTHERVAQSYFADGTIEWAGPPLRDLLEIMAHGRTSQGWELSSPEFRAQFERDAILGSDWYAARLDAQQDEAVRLAGRRVAALSQFIRADNTAGVGTPPQARRPPVGRQGRTRAGAR